MARAKVVDGWRVGGNGIISMLCDDDFSVVPFLVEFSRLSGTVTFATFVCSVAPTALGLMLGQQTSARRHRMGRS